MNDPFLVGALGLLAMFVLMDDLANVGGLSSELYRLAQSFLGHRRGGRIFATIGACAASALSAARRWPRPQPWSRLSFRR